MTTRDRLYELAYNLRWSWHGPARELFRGLDPELWERTGHNPVALLRRLEAGALASDASLAERAEAQWLDLRRYLTTEEVWYGAAEEAADRPLVAYFCAEFAITECLRIYSGGLGVLAGDHLKSASDMGVPLVGVGLLYRQGYFRQSLRGGRQRETFEAVDFDDLPLREVRRPDGGALRVPVPFPGRQVMVRVWRGDVGRVPLFLLDADIDDNGAADRSITGRLYGGEQKMRISQEIVLGMGGYRALAAMGIRPRSFHLNEGHSAFLGLDLVRDLMASEGLDFDEAVEATRQRSVFTTHTPVAAGHDRFSPSLMKRHLTAQARAIGLATDELLALGREDPDDRTEHFTMTVLGIRLAEQVNGVSRLHGRVSRKMWQALWPDLEPNDVPIDHITNGVHLPTWVEPELADLYGVAPGALGLDDRAPDPDPAALWALRARLRRRLLARVQLLTGVDLEPEALTIAFARRFATYKRATLLLSDPHRLAALVSDPDRPVQILFAGKAHPRDEGGKGLISRIAEVAGEAAFRGRIVFIPGYELDTAHDLVRGADVWLNNPRRPMEASGTSGMKAAANGALNVSVLDGWWDEAWHAARARGIRIGWAVGGRRSRAAGARGDAADVRALFDVLENEVVPLFYDRGPDGVPAGWVEQAVAAIRCVTPVFNSHRMVREYVERYRRAADAGAVRTR